MKRLNQYTLKYCISQTEQPVKNSISKGVINLDNKNNIGTNKTQVINRDETERV